MLKFEGESSPFLLNKDWERVQALGVLPDIKTPDIYIERVMKGMRDAETWISTKEDPIPTAQLVQRLHVLAFREVHPWAGEIRRLGQEVMVSGMECVDGKDVNRELERLTQEMKSEPFFGNLKYTAESISYYHVTFEAIHPFLDGNGRIGRLIMHHQMRLGFGIKHDTTLSREEYTRTLSYAQHTGQLKAFSRMMINSAKTKSMSIGREIL